MPRNECRMMSTDEWWAGLDHELSHVLVSTSAAHFVIPIVLVIPALTAWLFFN